MALNLYNTDSVRDALIRGRFEEENWVDFVKVLFVLEGCSLNARKHFSLLLLSCPTPSPWNIPSHPSKPVCVCVCASTARKVGKLGWNNNELATCEASSKGNQPLFHTYIHSTPAARFHGSAVEINKVTQTRLFHL